MYAGKGFIYGDSVLSNHIVMQSFKYTNWHMYNYFYIKQIEINLLTFRIKLMFPCQVNFKLVKSIYNRVTEWTVHLRTNGDLI